MYRFAVAAGITCASKNAANVCPEQTPPAPLGWSSPSINFRTA